MLTLGVFDGMHRGHQAILKKLQKRSYKKKYPRVLLTYYPHPDLVLGKRQADSATELFTYEEKLSLFQNFDLDAVSFLHFTAKIASMSAMRYLKEILLSKLQAKHIIIGYDQHFGRGRKGNYKLLKQMRHRYDFQVEQIQAVKYRREIVSSTIIRNYVLQGEIEHANSLLGHDFFIKSMVKRGQQIGYKLGFPTINLDFSPTKVIPKIGVYAGLAQWQRQNYRAMINVGTKPTFNNQGQIEIEAHLLGFQGTQESLYGEILQLFFKKRLRDEMKFETAELLSAQLKKDYVIVDNYKF